MSDDVVTPYDDRKTMVVTSQGPCRTVRYMVEPLLGLALFVYMMEIPVKQQLIYKQLSKTLQVNMSVDPLPCGALNASNSEENEVQKQTALWLNILQVVELMPALVSTTITGPLSDRIGRRPIIALSIFGGVLQSLTWLLVVRFDLAFYYIIASTAVYGAMGSESAILIGACSYIVDVSTPRQKLVRLAMLEALFGVFGAAGSSLSGPVIQYWGFTGIYSITMALGVVNLGYVLFLRESVNYVSGREDATITSPPGSGERSDSPDPGGEVSVWVKLKQTIMRIPGLFMKGGTFAPRWVLPVMLVGAYVGFGVNTSFYVNLVTYSLKSPICMNTSSTGFLTGLFCATFVTALLGIIILRRCVSLSTIAILGILSTIAALLVAAQATTQTMILFVPLAWFLGPTPPTMFRIMMSQLVRPDDQGALFALATAGQKLFMFIVNISATAFYAWVINFNPSLLFYGFIILLSVPLASIVSVKVTGNEPKGPEHPDVPPEEKPLLEDGRSSAPVYRRLNSVHRIQS